MAELRLVGGTLQLPSGSVTADAISTVSGQELDIDTLEVLYKPGTNFDLAIGATPVAREELVHICSTTGNIRGFYGVCVDTGTSADIDLDLKKNGTTVLSATLNITNSDSDGQVKAGTLSTSPTSVAADDRISIQLTVTSSTGMTGCYAWCEIQEVAQ